MGRSRPLSPLQPQLLLHLQLLLLAFAPPPALAARQDGQCRFPSRWEGVWFQSGVRQPIYIERDRLSSKGRCVASEGDKFVVVNDKGTCYRCVVIHEKHINVLQYKETFCHPRESLPALCALITGDALLYSMFRVDATPVACPFRGPFSFTYNRGHGECASPVSSIDSCTEDSRLLLRYQACPDVHGTESTVEELQCLATWKEGSSRYLVGKVHHSHATSNEDRFRCFVYEKSSVVLGADGAGGPGPGGGNSAALSSGGGGGGAPGGSGGALGGGGLGGGGFFSANGLDGGALPDFRVAQSGDATCNGLFSANEGSRTMTLRKAVSPLRCRFPAWLTVSAHWHTLDYSRVYAFSPRNNTLRISNASAAAHTHAHAHGHAHAPPPPQPQPPPPPQPAYGGVGGAGAGAGAGPAVSLGLTAAAGAAGAGARLDHQDMRVVCSEMQAETPDIAHLVAHFTMGCQSGYMCMMFYRRDGHVIEVQTGAHTRRMEDACQPAHFDRHSLPFVTLVTTSPELRECPHTGKFSVTGVQRGRARRAAAAGAGTPQRRGRRGPRDVPGAGPAAGGGGGGAGAAAGAAVGGGGGAGGDDFMPDEDACADAFLGTLAVGCASADTMEFRSLCTAAELVHSYSCHGRWEDNGTHFLITTPLSRRSHGARRLCFMYREASDDAGDHGAGGGGGGGPGAGGAGAGAGVVRFSSSSASCRRDIRPGVGGALAFNVTSTGQCMELGSSSTTRGVIHLILSLAVGAHFLALQLLTPR